MKGALNIEKDCYSTHKYVLYREVRRDDLTSIPPTYNLESQYFGSEYICTHTCNFAFFWGVLPNFSPRTSKRQALLHSTCVAMQMPLNADVEWQVLFKGHVLPTNCFLPIFRDACCEDWQPFCFAARDLGLGAWTWKPHGVAKAEKITQPDAWLGSDVP